MIHPNTAPGSMSSAQFNIRQSNPQQVLAKRYREKRIRTTVLFSGGIAMGFVFTLTLMALWFGAIPTPNLTLPSIPVAQFNVNPGQLFASITDIFTKPRTPIYLKYELAQENPLYPGRIDPVLSPIERRVKAKNPLTPMLALKEDTALKRDLEAVFAKYSNVFTPHLYFYDLQDHSYVNISGMEPVAAASLIKVPLLATYLTHVDEGLSDIRDDMLYLDFHRTGGSGVLQWQPSNQLLSGEEVATSMIRISDNTSTNMILHNVGGLVETNRQWQAMGLRDTQVHNRLPDLEGSNTTSPYELATIFYNLDQGILHRPESNLLALDIMLGTKNKRLIPWRLPRDIPIAHKTGDIGTCLGDAGIIYLPDGRRYILAMQVERPFNNYTARDMMQEASKIIFDYKISQQNQNTLVSTSSGVSPSSQRG